MKKPAITREACGTTEGHRGHSKRGEQDCEPCAEAWTERLKTPKHTKDPSADEIAAEIEWMLKLNQGTGYIMQAIGYTGREKSLRSRLQRYGHHNTLTSLLGQDAA